MTTQRSRPTIEGHFCRLKRVEGRGADVDLNGGVSSRVTMDHWRRQSAPRNGECEIVSFIDGDGGAPSGVGLQMPSAD